MSNKKLNDDLLNSKISKKEAEKILQDEIKKEGSIINGFYTGVIGTAHPYLREFCDTMWVQAIQMGVTLQNANQQSITNPDLMSNFTAEINKMTKSMNGMDSPTDILREAARKVVEDDFESDE